VNILFIVQYPENISPSQRFRIEIYKKLLNSNRYKFKISYFIDDRTRSILYSRKNFYAKITGIARGFLKRIIELFTLYRYDYIFIHREASIIGPPIFEWLYKYVFRKKIIFDFDDSIWISNEKNSILRSVKCYWKIKFICKWSYKISVGNEYLGAFARNYNSNVIYNPTCVDTESAHNVTKEHLPKSPVTIGWTGSFSNLIYLKIISDVLKRLSENYSFQFLVIADRQPDFPLPNLKFKYWRKETEISDLLELDIGVMPLLNTNLAYGKCGFKLIQYSALGLPVVASPVGVNVSIVDNRKTGFLCDSEEEWYSAFKSLIENHNLREIYGRNGREKIVKEFSVKANSVTFLSLFS
jgi:glycosyltransferase involved in cell wall biosynthesis